MRRYNRHNDTKTLRLESPFATSIIEESYTELRDEDLRSLIESAKARLYMRILFKTSTHLVLKSRANTVVADKLPDLLMLQCGPRMIALLEEVLHLREVSRQKEEEAEQEMAPPSVGSEEAVKQAYFELRRQMNTFLQDRPSAFVHKTKGKVDDAAPSHFDDDDIDG